MGDIDHVQKLEEAIFTFDKIITNKTASALLGEKTDKTKQIIDKFVKKCKESGKEVYTTYLVGGTTEEEKKKIIIAEENSYEKVKSGLRNVFVDEIYSIQKSKAVSFSTIFNIDDFLYTPISKVKKVPKVAETVSESSTAIKSSAVQSKKADPKKGLIASFTQPKSAKTTTEEKSKQQQKKTTPKNERKKGNDIKNMFSKVKPKENGNNSKNGMAKKNGNHNEISDDEDEVVPKRTVKKRSRILDDDDENENVPKLIKTDILDSDNESEKENVISEDEPDDEEMVVDIQESDDEKPEEPKIKEELEVKEEPKETTYQDDDGFFVTEKPAIKKTVKKTQPKTEEEKKEIKEQVKVEKKSKKELAEKLKKNTNQKTLFNFFKKV